MKNKKITDSFNYAFEGILHALRTERNIRIHVFAALLMLIFSLFFPLNRLELLILFLSISFVIMAEMFNTAVETVVDAFTDQYHPLAKVAKDVAAGAVLVAALNALLAGYLLFFHQVSPMTLVVWQKIRTSPTHLTFFSVLVVMVLVVAVKAVYIKRDQGRITLQGGMPSGHAALAFAASTAVSLLTNSFLIATLSLLLASLVAQSRIEGKIHTFWETIVGSLLGIGITTLIFQLLR